MMNTFPLEKMIDNNSLWNPLIAVRISMFMYLWRHMSGGTIFLFGFEKCLCRQPYCVLGSSLVCPNSVRPWACLSYVIVDYLIDCNRSNSVTDEFNKSIKIFSI